MIPTLTLTQNDTFIVQFFAFQNSISVLYYYIPVNQVVIFVRFEANFGQQTVLFAFKCMGLPEVAPGQIRILRKGNKMEVLV